MKYFNEKNLLNNLYYNDLEFIRLLQYRNKKLKSEYDDLLVRYNNLKKIYDFTLQLLRKEKEKNDYNVWL